VKIIAGMKYKKTSDQTSAVGIGSKLRFLDGTASLNRNVSTEINAANSNLVSDIVNLEGTSSDTLVVEFSYNEASANNQYHGEANTRLGWYNFFTSEWVLAVDGNTSGISQDVGDRAYNPTTDFQLGKHGVNTASNTAWAVVNHSGQFATVGITPPPTPVPTPTPVPITYSVTIKSSSTKKGTVSGGGNFTQNQTVTVKAKPKKGKKFLSWTENKKVVSKKATYSFSATQNRILVANFK
jgi:hypothetical protein